MAEYLDYDGLEYYHGKLSDELSDKQAQIDANTQSISSLSSTVISHTTSISALQNGKVDKVTGKGLSTNDFTNAYKAILDGGFDYVPYELVSGGSVDLDTLLLSRSDPPKKVYYCPQITTLIRNFPTANNQIYGAFILEVSKTSQSQTEEKVTLVQKLYFFPSTGFETITAAYGYYTRSRGWTTNPTASLTWTAWERDKAAETAVSAEQVKQDYISGSDHDYPVLASGDYDLTQGSITGTPFKMHGLKYNPKTGTLTADKFTGELNGNASTATNANYATTARSATEADHATSADSATNATSATRVRQTIAAANYNRPILLSYLQNTTTTSDITQSALYSNKFYANPSTGALTAPQFNGTLNGKAKSLDGVRVYINSTHTEEGWQKVAEWTNASVSAYYNFAITLLVNGGKASIAYGDNILKIFCYGNKTSTDVTNISNTLSSILSIRTTNVTTFTPSSSFVMTYTKNGKDITYKLWLHRTSANSGKNETWGFSILNAIDTEKGTNFINDINLLSNGTFSTGAAGYMTDGELAATDSVSCTLGTLGNATENSANQLKLNVASTTTPTKLPILCAPSASPTTALVQNVYKISEMTYQASTNTLYVDNVNGNAATATKLSGAQTVLYKSTTATTSFTLSGLFTNWSVVMIYLTGEWVSGTSGTHGFFVPLKHLKNRGNGGIQDFCGGKVINFLYVDDDSMRWFEYNGQGTMTYSSVRVVGLY